MFTPISSEAVVAATTTTRQEALLIDTLIDNPMSLYPEYKALAREPGNSRARS